MLVSTHDMELASQRFEQVALLDGRLIAYGAPGEVFTPEQSARPSAARPSSSTTWS